MSWEGGFVTKDEMYAAVPFGDKFMIIYKGQQVTVCETIDDAKKYIEKKHKPSRNKKVKKTALSEIIQDQ
jgi:hypothetical protein